MRGRGRARERLLAVYVLLVVAASALALAAHAPPWPGRLITIWEFLAFFSLALLLDLMVVPLAGGGGASASFAIYFAGMLSLGAAPAAWVAAIAGLTADGLLRRRALVKTAFNSGHSVLSLLLAGAVYAALGGTAADLKPTHMPAVIAAAIVLWLLETSWVAVAVALERGSRAWARLLHSLRPMLALDGALASVGLLLALLHQGSGQMLAQAGLLFLLAVAVIPSALLYYAYHLQGSVRETYRQSLNTLGSLMEADSESLLVMGTPEGPNAERTRSTHGEQVATLAAALAEALELPAPYVEQVRYAGYLHDIGKVGVPARLLHRQQRDLFEGEPSQVRLHPEIGMQILAPIHFLRPAAEMVRAHHERWDGLGYPNRLQGQAIPVGARILALADAYQGLTQGYGQAPLTPTQAMLRLRQSAGSRFEPTLVQLLERLLRAEGHISAEAASSLNYAGVPAP